MRRFEVKKAEEIKVNDNLIAKLKAYIQFIDLDYMLKDSNVLRILAMWLPCTMDMRSSIYRKLGVSLGKGTIIDFGVWLDPVAPEKIRIGEYVNIAYGVSIFTHFAGLNLILEYPPLQKEVIIHDHCCICANATILPGVEIGSGCIVGANSVVTKSIPPNSVAAGNPARIIYTMEEYCSKYEKEMKSNPENFSGIYPQECYKPPLNKLKGFLKNKAKENGRK